jgi:cell division septation protein DedD
MSESREASYYEIALTNTQVLVAFGILLLCVAGAFVSGMWVARESLRDRLAAAEVAQASPASAGGEGAQSTVEFFGDDTAAGRSGQAGEAGEDAAPPLLPPIDSPARSEGDTATTEAAGTAPAGRLAEAPPPEAAASEEDSSAPAETAQPRAGEPDQVAAAREEAAAPEEPAREPPPAGDAEAPGTGAPRAPDEPQPGAGAVVIQVLSSSDEAQANGLISRLRADGYRAFLSPVDVDGRTMYRVRVGPYDSRESAEVDAEKLKRSHRLDTWFPRS